MSRGCFVTGTDTGVGKTQVAVGLLRVLQTLGRTTAAMKPIASGCEATPDGLRNDDALRLQAAASVALPYELVNPVALAAPVAPHIAAAETGRRLSVAELLQAFHRIETYGAGSVVVEGVGGWMVPLNERETLADLACEIRLPVVLVVGMRLGCLSHALLTAAAIRQLGLPLAGWVANAIDPGMERLSENVETLALGLDAPLLGLVPFLKSPDPGQIAACLDRALIERLCAA